ncbi:site-specific integrase [Yoonia sp. 2307UL14-13]|uniref:site-specific integrase n=1 Tax=Yoonia sp. 2307UL14-13 TaxID=3126506 RepID=UPI0030B7B6A3
MAKLRQDEIRKTVRKCFKDLLAKYLEVLDSDGMPKERLAALEWTRSAHVEALGEDGFAEISDEELSGLGAKGSGVFSDDDWDDNYPRIQRERRLAHIGMIDAVLSAAKNRENYAFDAETDKAGEIGVPTTDAGLKQVIVDYIHEHSGKDGWTAKTTAKKQAGLQMLLEVLGEDVSITSIDKRDASKVKKILQEVPKNRNKLPQTRHLPLLEAIKVDGVAKISTVTVNGYISIYSAFFDWAERNGYVEHKLFNGMKVKGQKSGKQERKPFDPEAMRKMLQELTQNEQGLVKSESHKWATLIAMFTGARLNEICQLNIADIGMEDGIQFISITDEGEGNKRLKANASRRRVPVHPKLTELGFDAFVADRAKDVRLFSDYSYCPKNGHGRKLGRWFNDQLAPALGVKSESHKFHSFRHTMVTRLAQADVQQPIIQSIVGHEREGVTQQNYLREGYTLKQLSEALQKFEV